MITVVTATLGRRPEMLAEAVASVRSQTFGDWEHIIVDDGSFSVGPIEGARVLQVSHRGLGPARNAGVQHARGDVIALLDDDDVWLPHHLSTVYEAMQSEGADVVYAACQEVGRRDGYAIEVRDFDGEMLERENFLCVPATIIRTSSLLDAGGFPEGSLEDWELWKRMYRLGMSFVHVPVETVVYRFHDDNLTYGGVDPAKTAAVKQLRDDAEAGRISWDECARRIDEVWS